MRRAVIAGNWKMYKTAAEAVFLFQKIEDMVKEIDDVDIVVCPTFVALRGLSVVIDQDRPNIYLGAQNMHWEEEGAFTGEISPLMLRDLGCQFVILGHSERRQLFSETDEMVNKKVHSALSHSLSPILCVGETLELREADKTERVIESQVTAGLANIEEDQVSSIVMAYEPIWAIGTGRTATPEVAAETIKLIRKIIGDLYTADIAEKIRILYGGSVKPGNVDSLMSKDDIDGALVGGACLEPESFARIVKFTR